jgi:hypothetical protein
MKAEEDRFFSCDQDPYDSLFFSCHPVRGVRIYSRKEQTSPCGKKDAPAAMQIHRRITGDTKKRITKRDRLPLQPERKAIQNA